MGVFDKAFDTVRGQYFMFDRPAGATDTIDVNVAAGALAFDVVDATGLVVGQDLRVGSGETGELVRVTAVTAETISIDKKLKFAHVAGENVVELAAISIGVPEADGVRVNFGAETTDVFSAIQRTGYGVLNGYVDLGVSSRLMAITADVLALSLGLPRAELFGDGTAAVQTGTTGPRGFTSDGANFGALANLIIVTTGVKEDGTPVKLDFYNCSVDPTALNTTFSRGQLATVPVRTLASSGAADLSAVLWEPATILLTFDSNKGDLFSEIVEVERFTDSGTATTATAAITAGAFAIPLAVTTGVVAGTVLRLGAGDRAEYHEVHDLSGSNARLRTKVLRAHASGVAVVKQTITPIAGVTGGFRITASGQVTKRRSETNRMTIKTRASNIALNFACNVNNMRPETLQLIFGMPASAFDDDVLPLGNLIGTATSETLRFRGLTQNGKKVTIVGWNGSAKLGGEMVFSQAQEFAGPLSYQPQVMQVYVNA
ncbi:MAG TPA: hypothetical protein VE869_03650 [Gemmatimonas sp.]|nr:hypothetical protein [Gemmatimonas sp.]